MSVKNIHKFSLVACALAVSFSAQAAVTNIDGQAGGGLVPWALLSSGPTIAYTNLNTQNLAINSLAVNTSFANRVEVSYAHTMLDITGGGLGSVNNTDSVDNFGMKVKLLDMSDSMPQISLGAVYKTASGNLISNVMQGHGLGVDAAGFDFYGAVSKIVNIGGKNVLLNGVLRASKANQLGLLGFGGGTIPGADTGYSVEPEASVEVFASDNVIVGAEYRAQPQNAQSNQVITQSAAYDLNVVYVASKNFTLTAAYANLGQVAPAVTSNGNQMGMLLQAQVNF